MTEQRFPYHLRLAELSGLLCSGDIHPTKRTLALVSEKVRNPLVLNHEEALALLTRKYFRSHSPATLEDFVWWSGLNVNDCRRGIAALGDELRAERKAATSTSTRRPAPAASAAAASSSSPPSTNTSSVTRAAISSSIPTTRTTPTTTPASSTPLSRWTASSWATGLLPPTTAVSPSSTKKRRSRPSLSMPSSPLTAPPSSSNDNPQTPPI